MKKVLISPLFPLVIAIVIFIIALFCKQLENPLVAAGTVGAVVTAVWAIYYREIKAFTDRPTLEMGEPGFKIPFYRQAPEKNRETGHQVGVGYYINILLKNTGKRTARNCQPLLTGVWKLINGTWQQEGNWIPVALRWAGARTSM